MVRVDDGGPEVCHPGHPFSGFREGLWEDLRPDLVVGERRQDRLLDCEEGRREHGIKLDGDCRVGVACRYSSHDARVSSKTADNSKVLKLHLPTSTRADGGARS